LRGLAWRLSAHRMSISTEPSTGIGVEELITL
jgi:hypothetical protein